MQHLLTKDAQRIPDRPGSLVSTMALIDSAPLYLIVRQQERKVLLLLARGMKKTPDGFVGHTVISGNLTKGFVFLKDTAHLASTMIYFFYHF